MAIKESSLHPLVRLYIEKLVAAIEDKHPDHHCEVKNEIVKTVLNHINGSDDTIPFG